MSERRKWSEIRRRGNPALEQAFDTAINASLWLPALRGEAGLTQEQLAERLGVTQDWVSRMESETDVPLSTVHAYVTALGGQLRLCAALPDGRTVDLARAPQDEKVAATG